MRLPLNGQPTDVDALPERSLLTVLRDEHGLTAAKPGCGEGALAPAIGNAIYALTGERRRSLPLLHFRP